MGAGRLRPARRGADARPLPLPARRRGERAALRHRGRHGGLGAGWTLGAALAFLLARHGAAEAVTRLAGERLEPLQAAVERRGFLAVLYARILPGVPRDVANYAFGLTRVRLRDFTLATLIGIAPRAFAYTALGGSFRNLGSPEAIVAVIVLVLMGLGGPLLALHGRGGEARGAGSGG